MQTCTIYAGRIETSSDPAPNRVEQYAAGTSTFILIDAAPGFRFDGVAKQPSRSHLANKVFAIGEAYPEEILFSEITRAKPSLKTLGIRISVSYAKIRIIAGKPKKHPYFACCYNAGDLGDVNIVAFYHPLVADWDVMERNADAYRMRIRSAIREEMIHSTQVITVKSRYDRSIDLTRQFKTAERYYEHLLGKIIEELATSREGQEVVCTAAQQYYEDWSVTSMQELRETDRKLHGRDGYLVSEPIRQLVQIRFGELTSEEAKGKAWDQKRLFNTAKFGTTENSGVHGRNIAAGSVKTYKSQSDVD